MKHRLQRNLVSRSGVLRGVLQHRERHPRARVAREEVALQAVPPPLPPLLRVYSIVWSSVGRSTSAPVWVNYRNYIVLR